jgi:hypothetical protein
MIMRTNGVLWWVVTGLLGFLFFWRLQYLDHLPSTWDEVDYTLGINEYDVLSMQPHFPGYPFFILGGMLFSRLVNTPSEGLALFNWFGLLTASFPIYRLSCHYLPPFPSFVVMTVTQSLSYIWIVAAQPMSDGAALGVLWWYIYSLLQAYQSTTSYQRLLPILFFSLLMGIRLSYAPFGIGLVWLWMQDAKQRKNGMLMSISLFILGQMLWIVPVVKNVGGIYSLLSIGSSFIHGHFNEWGRGNPTESLLFGERMFRYLISNWFWEGFSSHSTWLLIFHIVVIFIFLGDFFRKGRRIRMPFLLLIMIITYGCWSFFGQNIEKTRHLLPLLSLTYWWLCLHIVSKRIIGYILIVTLMLGQMSVGEYWLNEQKHEVPPVVQAYEYLSSLEGDIVVYTWEETRVFDYMKAPFHHKRLQSFNSFLHDIKGKEKERIILTNKVLEGFATQGIDVNGKVKKMKAFETDPILDPVYHHIVLYEWVPGGEDDE